LASEEELVGLLYESGRIDLVYGISGVKKHWNGAQHYTKSCRTV
jgi:hypothetical protein